MISCPTGTKVEPCSRCGQCTVVNAGRSQLGTLLAGAPGWVCLVHCVLQYTICQTKTVGPRMKHEKHDTLCVATAGVSVSGPSWSKCSRCSELFMGITLDCAPLVNERRCWEELYRCATGLRDAGGTFTHIEQM